MMSYTMECTSLCDSGGILMRFMSPSTRIMGGTPEDRWRSEALFLTANARSCAISTAIDAPRPEPAGHEERGPGLHLKRSGSIEGSHIQYVNESAEFARRVARSARAHGTRRCGRRP